MQLLAVTGDNAAPNDTMVEELAKRLDDFGGMSHRGRCFDHVVNLCAKAVLRPFDAERKKQGKELTKAEQAFEALMDGLDLDEGLDLPAGEDLEDEDDIDGLVDGEDELDDDMREELHAGIPTVKLLLTKVCASPARPLTCR